MNLKNIVPELVVNDILISIEFYKNNLGFILEMTDPETPPYSWCQLSLDNLNIMLFEHNSADKEIKDFPKHLSSTNIIVLKYDDTEGVKELYQTLKNKNINFYSELKETDYGTVEFGILDPDNYMILISAEE